MDKLILGDDVSVWFLVDVSAHAIMVSLYTQIRRTVGKFALRRMQLHYPEMCHTEYADWSVLIGSARVDAHEKNPFHIPVGRLGGPAVQGRV